MDRLAEFEPVFYPRSVAVVGASDNPMKFGGGFFKTLQDFGFKGKTYPVNPRITELMGAKVYPSVNDIPEPVDMAHIMVPAHHVASVIEDCALKGVKVAQIFTAGFTEVSEEGRQLEIGLVHAARRGGIRIIGPNCFGVYCPGSGLTLLPGYDFPKETGSVGFLSQSGGYAAQFCGEAKGWGIRFSKVVSYGNACDLNEADLLEYLAQDPETKIITMYVEGPRDGQRFANIVKEASKTKPVIIWKGGLTEIGARAVHSHTCSLGGEEASWNALFKQTCAIRVTGLEELMDTTLAFLHLPPTIGKRIAMVGGGGGINVAAADVCDQAGLCVPPFAPEIQEEIRKVLPPAGTGVRNPVDVGAPVVPPPIFQSALESAARADNTDAIIATQAVHYLYLLREMMSAFLPPDKSLVEIFAEAPLSVKTNFGKPIIMVLPTGGVDVETIDAERERRVAIRFYLERGIPVYPTLERAAKSVANVANYYEKVRSQ